MRCEARSRRCWEMAAAVECDAGEPRALPLSRALPNVSGGLHVESSGSAGMEEEEEEE